MTNILIVDDSSFMRNSLRNLLSHYSDFNVIGTERNGVEAIKYLDKYHKNIDVVILDFFMPKMDGIETLKNIVEKYPIPTIMITIANEIEHADLYFKALNLGAIDIISKPIGSDTLYLDQIEELLVSKIRFAEKTKQRLKIKITNEQISDNVYSKIQSDVEQQNIDKEQNEFLKKIISYKSPQEILGEVDRETLSRHSNFFSPYKLVVIGASTGGPTDIIQLLKSIEFNPNLSILIIQHMPSMFTSNFAKRLNNLSPYPITELSNNEEIKAGCGYVAPGGYQMKFDIIDGQIITEINQDERIWGVRPAIDYTLPSIGRIFKENSYAIILTGMGQDGAYGIQKIKNNGGITIVQDPEEALIDSMPIKAIQTGSIDQILRLSNITNFINNLMI